jgi:hypothetical protein
MITMDPIYARSFFDALVTDNSRRSVDTSNHRLRNSVKHAVPLELRRPRFLVSGQFAGGRGQHRADQRREPAASLAQPFTPRVAHAGAPGLASATALRGALNS